MEDKRIEYVYTAVVQYHPNIMLKLRNLFCHCIKVCLRGHNSSKR